LGPPAETRIGGPPTRAQPSDFANLLKNSGRPDIEPCRTRRHRWPPPYEAGDKSVDLTKVMLEVQKASLAFHAMTEVRKQAR